jgi:beta-lactamase class A
MRTFLLLVFLVAFTPMQAQKTDRSLQRKLDEQVRGFKGDIGVYIKNLRTGRVVTINADTVFPTASVIKVPILVGIMKKIESGELNYEQELIYKDSLLYAGVDILGSFRNNEKIVLKKVIMLMETTSDNTASLWLQSLAGTGTRINELMDSLGLKFTRVNSRTPGRESNRANYGWGQTTPREMGALMEMIYYRKIASPAISDQAMRCLSRNYNDQNEGISVIPPTIAVFSKNGCLDEVRNEIILVNAPRNPYILSIFTKNNLDKSWSKENEAWKLTREISSLLWDKWKD